MFGLSTKKKMIFIAVIMLLFLIILLFLNPTSILFLPKTFESFNNNIFKLNFLTKQQASNVFSDSKKFHIIKKFQIKETIVRTNYHNSYIDRTDLQNKALQLYKNKVKNFTQEEINILISSNCSSSETLASKLPLEISLADSIKLVIGFDNLPANLNPIKTATKIKPNENNIKIIEKEICLQALFSFCKEYVSYALRVFII